MAPIHNGQVVPPEEFNTWPEAKRHEIQAAIEALEKELEHVIRQIPQWERQRRDEVRQLGRDTAKYAVHQLIDETKDAFSDIPRVIKHIEAVQANLVDNVAVFGSRARTARAYSPSCGLAVPSTATRSTSS